LAETSSAGVGRLVGGTARTTDNSAISIGILSESCILEVSTEQTDGSNIPSTQKEASNPDGTIQGTVALPARTDAGTVQMRGRTRTFLSRDRVVCLIFIVPEDQFAAKSSAIQKILDAAIIQ
jgi:hypothetical protein